MNIQFNNVGKVKEAGIKIDGISVISGNNCAGKTTLARAIYTTINAFTDMEEKIINLKVSTIVRLCIRWFENSVKCSHPMYFDNIQREFINSMSITIQGYHSGNVIAEPTLIKMVDWANQLYEYPYQIVSDPQNEELFEQMNHALNQSDDDFMNSIINENLKNNCNINSILNNEPATIVMEFGKKLTVAKNRVVENTINKELFEDMEGAIYHNFCSGSESFNDECNEKLATLPRIYNRDTLSGNFKKDQDAKDEILKMIEGSINGHFVSHNGVLKFKDLNKKNYVDVENMGSSLYIFAMIARLLENNSLKRNGTLILDAPVANLHLQWYEYLSQIFFTMYEKLNINTIVVTTNPKMIQSIIEEKQSNESVPVSLYYLEESDHSTTAKNVSNKLNLLYSKLES